MTHCRHWKHASACAISFSWWGNLRSMPPVWRSRLARRLKLAKPGGGARSADRHDTHLPCTEDGVARVTKYSLAGPQDVSGHCGAFDVPAWATAAPSGPQRTSGDANRACACTRTEADNRYPLRSRFLGLEISVGLAWWSVHVYTLVITVDACY